MFLRNPENTRQQLLHAACEEIHRYGFQAASLSRILAKTKLTKGALYHHFKNKTALGYAVVEELIQQEKITHWVEPLAGRDDPITCLIDLLMDAAACIDQEDLCLGFILHNLAQEMSPVDEGFRTRINHIYQCWQDGLASALAYGQGCSTVRRDIDPAAAATFIVAAMEGCMALTKQAQNVAVLHQCGKGLVEYLQGLRSIQENTGE